MGAALGRSEVTMSVREPVAQILSYAAVMEERDDHSLLQSIAARRDEAAFSELCARFGKRELTTAFRILQDAALAEDAVQEAMLSIWQRSATAVQPTGESADWILRIVTNKSLHVRRSQKNSSKREERMTRERTV